MPSDRTANDIRRSLAEGERFRDFAYLFDALMLLRRPYNPDIRLSEKVTGRLLCVTFPDKPKKYVRAMQEFRLRFSQVSDDAELQAEFSNCVKQAAISLRQPEGVVWRPSLYFSLSPRLQDLPEWF